MLHTFIAVIFPFLHWVQSLASLYQCSEIITPTVNIIVYNSLFQCCNRHRQLLGYLSFNSLTLEPSCRHWFDQHTINRHNKLSRLACKRERNKASLNSAIYLRCCYSESSVHYRCFHRETAERHCLHFEISNKDLVSYCILINFTIFNGLICFLSCQLFFTN